MSKISLNLITLGVFLLVGCQTPTKVSELDKNLETRVFSKIEYGKEVELKRSVIVDVRPQFEHQMSRPPRSFNALAEDWDLNGYAGEQLDKKASELQRLLSLKGIDPLTQVVILGKGLNGKGEEFLLASTLMALGVERISFMNEAQAKKAFVAKGLPQLENVPKWSRSVEFPFFCGSVTRATMAQKMSGSDIVISKKFMEKGGELFDDSGGGGNVIQFPVDPSKLH